MNIIKIHHEYCHKHTPCEIHSVVITSSFIAVWVMKAVVVVISVVAAVMVVVVIDM